MLIQHSLGSEAHARSWISWVLAWIALLPLPGPCASYLPVHPAWGLLVSYVPPGTPGLGKDTDMAHTPDTSTSSSQCYRLGGAYTPSVTPVAGPKFTQSPPLHPFQPSTPSTCASGLANTHPSDPWLSYCWHRDCTRWHHRPISLLGDRWSLSLCSVCHICVCVFVCCCPLIIITFALKKSLTG